MRTRFTALFAAITLSLTTAVACWSGDDETIDPDAGLELEEERDVDDISDVVDAARNFRVIQPVAMTPQGGQCDGTNGGATMRVVFFDDADEPIKPGEEVALAFVEPQSDDLNFSDGAFYEMPDVDCSADSDCQRLHCNSTPSGDIGQRCQGNTGVSVSSAPVFVGVEPQSQALAIGMSTVGRWRGWFSTEFDGHYVFNEDGPNEPLHTGPIDAVAADPERARIPALRDLGKDWRTLQHYVSRDGRTSHFGFWLFGESPDTVLSQIIEPSPGESLWTQEPAVAESGLSNIPSVQSGRSDVYASILEVMNQGFQADEVQNVDHRSVIFLVSGYDERKRQDVDAVITEANNQDITVSIIQVDAPRDRELLRDDWAYYDGEGPCDDDGDCKNFESCRVPTAYVEEPSTDDPDDIVYPREEQLGNTYCLPDYDENGRVGPIADYDRLACETGGSYTYVPLASRSMIHDPLEGALFAPEAAWEFDLSMADFERLDAGKAHLLETSLEVTIGRTNRVHFDQDGSSDRRRAFFTP